MMEMQLMDVLLLQSMDSGEEQAAAALYHMSPAIVAQMEPTTKGPSERLMKDIVIMKMNSRCWAQLGQISPSRQC